MSPARGRAWGIIALLALLLSLLALASAADAAGELDPTFDGDGMVLTDFGASDEALGVAVQSDGKIVAAGGSTAGAAPADFELARYNPDGSLDAGFDGDGKVTTDFGARELATDVAVQADGKIVVVGGTESGLFDFALARYNPDGSLDASFDGDGKAVTDFGGADLARSVAVQPDGKIVAAGENYVGAFSNFALARYNQDGSLDPGFDGDGKVLTDFFGASELALDVAIHADGRIVAAGETSAGPNPFNFALARYLPDGTLDASFDGDGRVVTDFGQVGATDSATSVAIQADGRIVAAGGTFAGPSPFNFALARYLPDGTLDASFDGDGRVVTDFGNNDGALGVAIQTNGRIVAAGGSEAGTNPSNFALARYLPGGALDPSFDGDGRVLTDFGANDGGEAVALQGDGRIVAAGSTAAGPDPPNFALARYLGDQAIPTDKSQCMNGGYAGFGFKNQGQCVAFVERGSKP